MVELDASKLTVAASTLAKEAAHFDAYVRSFLKGGRAREQSQAFRAIAEGLYLMAIQLEADARDDLKVKP